MLGADIRVQKACTWVQFRGIKEDILRRMAS